MSVEVVCDLPREDWARFVDEHPDGNVFHTPEMFDVFARVKNHRPEVWAAVDGSRIQALFLPVQVSVFGGWRSWLSTRAVVYGGALCTEGRAGAEALSLLLRDYDRRVAPSVLFTEVRNVSDATALQPAYLEAGYGYEPHLNYLVRLEDGPEAVLARIGKRTRKNIRRGLNRGVVAVEEIGDERGLTVCYDLLSATYLRARVPLADVSLLRAALEVLGAKGMVRVSRAAVDGATAAVSIDLLYRDVAFGWYGGTDRSYAAESPNELLTWRVLEWAAESGYRTYDFGGAGHPDVPYPVRDFKAKFGGELVGYGRNTRIHSPRRLRLTELGYEAYRRLVLGRKRGTSADAGREQ